jgi:hypothetical protein
VREVIIVIVVVEGSGFGFLVGESPTLPRFDFGPTHERRAAVCIMHFLVCPLLVTERARV